MPLSPPRPRQHLHTREIDIKGYYREDGLWDIEANITDKKTYTYEKLTPGIVAAGHPVHDMSLRLSVDSTFTVREVEAVMNEQPYTVCSDVLGNFQRLIGLTIGPGWNKKAREAVGGVAGCTHIAELLGPMATAAFQTLAGDYAQQLMAETLGENHQQEGEGKAPFMLNGCYAWRPESEVVKTLYPDFYEDPQTQPVKIVE